MFDTSSRPVIALGASGVLDVSRAVDPGLRPSVHDVSAAIDAAVAIQAQIDALEGSKLLAVERARRAAERCERELLDDGDLELRRASAARRSDLARRAFIADLATALRLSEQQSSHLVDTARTLTAAALRPGGGTEPERSTLAELCRGRFSAAHARAMADTLDELPDHARARVEAAALPCAATTTPAQFRRRLRRAREVAHPQPLAERHADAAQKRAVYLDPAADGMAWLTAHLPAPEAHAAFDRLTATARSARDAGDLRTTAQLRADALADLLLAAPAPADDPAPGLAAVSRRISPTVHVTVPVMSLLGGDAPGELDGYGPIDADTSAALTARAPSLRRVLVDPVDGRALTVDPGTYAVPTALRTFLQARDGVCRFPGCTRRAARCDVDHVHAWSDGGRTTADNLAHLCRHHHVLKHQTRWKVERRPGGTLAWTSPTGRVYHDRIPAQDLVLRRTAEHDTGDSGPPDPMSPHS